MYVATMYLVDILDLIPVWILEIFYIYGGFASRWALHDIYLVSLFGHFEVIYVSRIVPLRC